MEGPEDEQTLNYDFNYNLVLGKSLMANLSLPQDRQLATEWLQKLSTCDQALDVLRLRNLFAYHLVLAMQDGLLRPPYDAAPPAAPLSSLQDLLPNEAYADTSAAPASAFAEDSLGQAAEHHHSRRPYDYSPDGGEFFGAQPVPRCGAFCYLAVVARQDQ